MKDAGQITKVLQRSLKKEFFTARYNLAKIS
jgi:hypothetical protein